MSDTLSALPEQTRANLRTLGEGLQLARRRRFISQKDLAVVAHVPLATLRRIENGDPSVRIGAYCAVLNHLGLDQRLSEVAASERDPLGQTDPPLRIRTKVPTIPKVPKSCATVEAWCILACTRARYRNTCSLTPKFLQDLWKEQEGRCALSHLPLDPKSIDMMSPSLDRIDSSRGYEQDNVQIVVRAMNYMKGANSQTVAQAFVAAMMHERG